MKYNNRCSSNSILVRFYITFVAHSEQKIILSNIFMIILLIFVNHSKFDKNNNNEYLNINATVFNYPINLLLSFILSLFSNKAKD